MQTLSRWRINLAHHGNYSDFEISFETVSRHYLTLNALSITDVSQFSDVAGISSVFKGGTLL
jgi:hypothetical protein